MQWTRTDATRRRIVVIGLIAGPALLALSNAFDIQAADDSMRAVFDAMTANPTLLMVQSMLEGVGFMILLASFAGASHATRTRGGALGTWGAALCVVGILGFGFSSAHGTTFFVLTQLPDHEAGYAAAVAVASNGVTGMIEMVMMFAGQLGICLVIGALIRARVIRIWPLLLVVVGIIVNTVFEFILTTLIADLLLLAASAWVATALARSPRDVWFGAPSTVTALRATQPV